MASADLSVELSEITTNLKIKGKTVEGYSDRESGRKHHEIAELKKKIK